MLWLVCTFLGSCWSCCLSVTVWLNNKVLLCTGSSSCFYLSPCHKNGNRWSCAMFTWPLLTFSLFSNDFFFFIFIPLFCTVSQMDLSLLSGVSAVWSIAPAMSRGNTDRHSCPWHYSAQNVFLKTHADFKCWCVFCGCASEWLIQWVFQWFRGCWFKVVKKQGTNVPVEFWYSFFIVWIRPDSV